MCYHNTQYFFGLWLVNVHIYNTRWLNIVQFMINKERTHKIIQFICVSPEPVAKAKTCFTSIRNVNIVAVEHFNHLLFSFKIFSVSFAVRVCVCLVAAAVQI